MASCYLKHEHMSKKPTDPLTRIRQRIRDDAASEGFGDIAFTSAEAVPHLADRLDAFIEDGHHGSMAWIPKPVIAVLPLPPCGMLLKLLS